MIKQGNMPSLFLSIHELDKLIPWEYQEKVSACCYPQVLSSRCHQSSLLLGSSDELI